MITFGGFSWKGKRNRVNSVNQPCHSTKKKKRKEKEQNAKMVPRNKKRKHPTEIESDGLMHVEVG